LGSSSESGGVGQPSGGGADDDTGPIPIGVTLDNKYLVRRVLGRGSMGMVYHAYDLALEREVAIKVLLPHYSRDPKVAKRFRREAVAMASVRHEHVVQIFAFGDHESHPYFVMEYIPGHTVATLIESASQRGEQLYLDVVIGILNQTCRGLQAVHDRGIVHRDVKPANMLIGPRFRVALADFGLVEKVQGTLAKRDLAGTPLYIAPELIQNKPIGEEELHLCDIYALGVSAFEMLTGKVPFDGATIKEILHRHVEEPPPAVSTIRADIPTAVDEVIARALDKVPANRFRSAMEFLEALGNARANGPAVSIAPRRILIVDDDPDVRTIYTTALTVGLPGTVILTAADGLTAVEMVKCSPPDLVLLDMDMPRMNGLEVCASLNADEVTARVPLMVLSAHVCDRTKELLHKIGVRDVLRKPVELRTLVDLARRRLKLTNEIQ
jgi:eukaryotic-like serine/threonine-protein kinase